MTAIHIGVAPRFPLDQNVVEEWPSGHARISQFESK